MYLVLFVLDDCDKTEELLDAWENIGVSGVTVLHSTGLGRIRNYGLRDDLPLLPSLESLTEHEEYFNRTLFTVIKEDALIDEIVSVTEDIVGDLTLPNSGLLIVVPVLRAYGIDKRGAGEEGDG